MTRPAHITARGPTALGWVSLIALTAGALAGCQSQPLSIELSRYTPAQCITYTLQDDGRLTIQADGGFGGPGRSRQLYDCQIDQAAMTRLKNVVSSSGVLLASSAGEGLQPGASAAEGMGTGPAVRAVIKLGLWENKLETFGEPLPSLQAVIEELNANLPRQYHFIYGSRTVGEEAKQQDAVWR